MLQKILIVDDDKDVLSALKMLLNSEGFSAVVSNSPEQVIPLIREQEFSLIIMDLNYTLDTTSGEEGLKLVKAIRDIDELIPIVVMTGWGTIEVAVNSMKMGANDFIQKPWENERLLTIIRNQLNLARSYKTSLKLVQQNKLLQEEVNPTDAIIAESDLIKTVLSTIKQVARSDVSVLFTGENGTGKSLFARYLHEASRRKDSPHVAVNMGAVTESLFESEMFGHIKGAFTDAKSTRIGRFELADEGTLFLDEIANTPFSQQAKLLRVLEDSQFEKVGATKTQTVNIRLVTATNSDLLLAVEQGIFRKDLYYRINAIEINIPPLRKRVSDILPMANAFLEKLAKKYGQTVLTLSKSAEVLLEQYQWPGNVRELGHVMERAHIMCQSSVIENVDLGISTLSSLAGDDNNVREQESKADELLTLSDIENTTVETRLNYFKGDALKAAISLGLSRSAFYRKLDKLKLKK